MGGFDVLVVGVVRECVVCRFFGLGFCVLANVKDMDRFLRNAF